MSFKVLIADDEYIIRRGIRSFLEQYEEFQVTAEAEDGEMALELARQEEIDVYLVDINMPFVNGLQFIEQLREIHPKALVVVITGYDRFEYAREALRLGTFEYLLKPIMEEPFDEMIQKVKARLLADKSEDKYLKWAKKMLEKNRKYLSSEFLKGILAGKFTKEEIEERCSYLDMVIPEEFTLSLVRLSYRREEDLQDAWSDDLIYFVAENIADELFSVHQNLNSCQDDYGNLVVLSGKIQEEKEAQKQRETYCKIMEEHAPVRCSVIQKTGKGLEMLSEIYDEAVLEMEKTGEASAVIREVRKFVETHYHQESFSLQDAAGQVNLSIQYLSKLFRKEMGITFSDYLTSVRIRKSIELIQNDELKIYEIAEKVGYTTQHYFSNVFKKCLGVSPAEYRKGLKKS